MFTMVFKAGGSDKIKIFQRRIQEPSNSGTSKMEVFVKLVNDFQLSAVFNFDRLITESY